MSERLWGSGVDHADTARYVGQLSSLLLEQGRVADAEPLLVSCLEMCQRMWRGQSHTSVARALTNLALARRAQGRFLKAEVLLSAAVEMLRRIWGPRDSRDVVIALSNLGAVQREEARTAEALASLTAALDMCRRLGDDGLLGAMFHNLGVLYHRLGRETEALPLLEECVTLRRRVCGGVDHYDVVVALVNHAVALRSTGQVQEATVTLGAAQDMATRLAVPPTDSVAVAMRVLRSQITGVVDEPLQVVVDGGGANAGAASGAGDGAGEGGSGAGSGTRGSSGVDGATAGAGTRAGGGTVDTVGVSSSPQQAKSADDTATVAANVPTPPLDNSAALVELALVAGL
jgi:hypothetical protein